MDDPSDVQVLSVGVQLDTCPLILFPVLLCLRDCIFQTPLLAGFQLIIAMKGTCVRSEVRRLFFLWQQLCSAWAPGLWVTPLSSMCVFSPPTLVMNSLSHSSPVFPMDMDLYPQTPEEP